MSKEKQLVIKEADITNNCPECFNQELSLTFYQKHTFNAFFHRTTGEVTHEIKCKTCNSTIYPVNWTEDIERVFEYYSKLVQPDRPSVRFTTLFFILLIALLCLVAAGVYFYLEHFNQ
ncbi:hypothetical protein [Flagellimonas zhangzhouensis]|uniref:Uncharacterized protein n=1 Tax=Flagellimonas zhangzhouensis TaxID=1073328 RepID=A0A1H2VDL8_9FLAO|nr:hypothetical protein [Allomuricauda zhangzhouensis]SDQ08674.1 hypothetical protein SAMN05216294_0261 [Allomuricauda zhangzhouensis]SDW66386.1 hypothetical protein SAMN04487892_2032 [Allomuricauda zhangzhouensis]